MILGKQLKDETIKTLQAYCFRPSYSQEERILKADIKNLLLMYEEDEKELERIKGVTNE